jgi:putative ABC transport system permease protein
MLRWILPLGVGSDEIRGDLREEYVRLRMRRGRTLAGLWFRWEAFKLIVQLGLGGGGVMGFIRDDLRHAVRGLRRSPGFTLIAIATIAIGLGANAAVFAVLQAVVIAPLPFEDPASVVAFRLTDNVTKEGNASFSFPQYEDFVSRQRSFERLAAWQGLQPSLQGQEGLPPLRVRATAVTHTMLPLLGVEPDLGRGFTGDDDAVGGHATALVSHAFWMGMLGGDPDVLARSLRLDGVEYAIVGVLPASFRGETSGGGTLPPAQTDVWLPYRNSPAAEGLPFRSLHNVNVVGRVKEGVTLQAARFDVERVMAELREEYAEHARDGAKLIPAHEAVVGNISPTMLMLFGAATLVLLIACTNVANLALSRATARAPEMAVRTALGAGYGRLVRLMLAESAVLAVAGAAAGAVLVRQGLGLLAVVDPGTIPRFADSTLDPATAAYLVGATLVVTLILGLVPLTQFRDSRLHRRLRDGGRGMARGRSGSRRSLVVVQVAAAVILLMGAGLLLRSLEAVLGVDPGYEPEGLLSARIVMPTPFVSPDWPEHVAFFREITESLEGVPGVTSAAAGYWDPSEAGWQNGFRFLDRPAPKDGREPSANYRPVSLRYFETVGIPLLRGRTFTAADDSDTPGVVVVNEAFVRRYFGGADPIGVQLDYGDFWGARPREYEIVGVVGDVRFSGLSTNATPATYFAHAQQPVREMDIVIRVAGDPLAVVPELRRTVASRNPELPVDGIGTIEAKLSDAVAGRRFLAWVLGAFALVALSLSAVGIYGVLSFVVARRTHEIGIRMAIGARRDSVLGQILREGLGLVALGLLIGLPAALGLTRLMDRLLFEVSPMDPATVVAVPLILALVGLAACTVPALRATRVDPLRAMRTE